MLWRVARNAPKISRGRRYVVFGIIFQAVTVSVTVVAAVSVDFLSKTGFKDNSDQVVGFGCIFYCS